MPAFKNAKFVKRDYECTNIVAAVADAPPTTSPNGYVYGPGDWELCEMSELQGLDHIVTVGLGMQAVVFYGYL